MSYRAVATISCVLVGLAAPTRGDSVRLTNRLVYQEVRVLGVVGGQLRFRLPNGRILAKPLEKVAAINLTGAEAFNRAEAHLAKGRLDQAEAAYVRAARDPLRPWLGGLIRHRRLALAEKCGRIDRAVKLWLEIADAARASPAALALRPRKLAPAGSEANRRAITLLKTKLSGVRSKPYQDAIRRLLVDLYERQGQLAQAESLQSKLAAAATRRAAPAAQGTEVSVRLSADAHIRLAALALKAGNYEKIPPLIRPRLKRIPVTELPTALYLLGRAQLELAGKKSAPAARKMLLQAGLNLMRVAALFPSSQEAPHALLSAGRVNELLGNVAAARAAYSAVVTRYRDSPAARDARSNLERLEQSKPKEQAR